MAYGYSTLLPPDGPEGFIETVRRGGWYITGGLLVRDMRNPNIPRRQPKIILTITDISQIGAYLHIKARGRDFQVLANKTIIIDFCTIEVRETIKERRQRRKLEGAGWYSFPVERVSLKVTNPTLKTLGREHFLQSLIAGGGTSGEIYCDSSR